jgi:hypothetical protein
MRTAPTLTARALTWLAVFGLLFAGVPPVRTEIDPNLSELRIGTADGAGAKFVAFQGQCSLPASLAQLHKVWSWVSRPPTAIETVVRLPWRMAIQARGQGRVVPRRPSLVGVVELRI